MKIKLKFTGTGNTGPPIVTLLGIKAISKAEIRASFFQEILKQNKKLKGLLKCEE